MVYLKVLPGAGHDKTVSKPGLWLLEMGYVGGCMIWVEEDTA